jgi:hypothetical protein
MTRVKLMGLFVILAALTACASSPPPSREQARAQCMLTAADSAYIAGGPLYRDCAVDSPAKALANRLNYDPSARPDPRPQPGTRCYAADVTFVVGPDGRPEPETVRLVRSNDAHLGQSLVRSVADWRYSPALRDGVPVRQIVQERRAVAVAVSVVSSASGRPARPPAPPRCS